MEETDQLNKAHSKNRAAIFERDLDETSGFTHVYLASVVHNDVAELKKRLK